MSLTVLPRATLRELAVSAAVGRTTDPSVVALLAETLLDSLENIVLVDNVHDDAADLPSFVETLAKERNDAIEEENDTIRDLRADVDRLENENQEQAEKILDLEKEVKAAFSGEKIQALIRERDELAALRETHARELDAAREETRDLRKKILAVAAEDGGVLCRLPGCYNEVHSSDGRCTFHRGDEPLADDHTPAVAAKKRTRGRKVST